MEQGKGQVKTYEYDQYNQLIRVQDYDGDVVYYGYDGLGNRVY
ncbi:MAG: hypothetical protein LBR25_05380, partial [Erysipelotrichaceae bacterium]|nr:hypothetical protein [Erysipelotrichaceae bacterium]